MAEKKVILVVDDEPDLREMVEYQFKAKNYTVETAGDGIEALEKLGSVTPDLIILDLNMPRMGGIEFYHRICGEGGRPKYPVLILTARANTEQLFKEFDIDGFITKPFDIDQLIKEAEIIVKKKNREIIATPLIAGEEKNIFIVENAPDRFNAIGQAFLNAGYNVQGAKSGTAAIEKMMATPPALALIDLSLVDIPGDLVIQRLQRMPKTTDIKVILYVKYAAEHDRSVFKQMAQKTGVMKFVEYTNVEELVDAADVVYKEKK